MDEPVLSDSRSIESRAKPRDLLEKQEARSSKLEGRKEEEARSGFPKEHCFTDEWLEGFKKQKDHRRIDKIILKR